MKRSDQSKTTEIMAVAGLVGCALGAILFFPILSVHSNFLLPIWVSFLLAPALWFIGGSIVIASLALRMTSGNPASVGTVNAPVSASESVFATSERRSKDESTGFSAVDMDIESFPTVSLGKSSGMELSNE